MNYPKFLYMIYMIYELVFEKYLLNIFECGWMVNMDEWFGELNWPITSHIDIWFEMSDHPTF